MTLEERVERLETQGLILKNKVDAIEAILTNYTAIFKRISAGVRETIGELKDLRTSIIRTRRMVK